MIKSRLKRKGRFWAFLTPLLVAAGLQAQYPEGDLPTDWGYESTSPEQIYPSAVEPGLNDRRAVPIIPTPEPKPSGYVPLFRLTRPYYDSIFAPAPPSFREPMDPSTFRSVTAYQAPLGLQPRRYSDRLFFFEPVFSLSQSFDSNVNLSPDAPVADFYITPRVKLSLQLGTPDSEFVPALDTILAFQASYEGYGDIFYLNPDFSAYNQKFEFTGRIGRGSAIWRPFVYASDLVGNDVLTRELNNRTRRIRVSTGFIGQYQLTNNIGWQHQFDYGTFQHPDPSYINLNSYGTRQDLSYQVLRDFRALGWAGFRHSTPTRGSSGNEFLLGLGWAGKLDPRLFSELHIGWGFLDMDGNVPNRNDLSGLRFNGYTTFAWGPRFAFTLLYDRNYVYNEIGTNDNYVSTLLQFKGEFYLGDNWYITPYLGIGYDVFETSHNITFQWRPELEVSYALPTSYIPNSSRIYIKVGYQESQTIRGAGDTVQGFRLSIGAQWQL